MRDTGGAECPWPHLTPEAVIVRDHITRGGDCPWPQHRAASRWVTRAELTSQPGPNPVALRTPCHPLAGRGGCHRRTPTGGAANGIPLNAATPLVHSPRNAPCATRASQAAVLGGGSFPPSCDGERAPKPGGKQTTNTTRRWLHQEAEMMIFIQQACKNNEHVVNGLANTKSRTWLWRGLSRKAKMC